ncbi:unnamed protein product, partial [Allacma fusca]
RSDSCHRWS